MSTKYLLSEEELKSVKNKISTSGCTAEEKLRLNQAFIGSAALIMQPRVDYMDAVAIYETKVEHVFKEYKTIASQTICDFLVFLKNKYPDKKLNIICNNPPYYKSVEKFYSQSVRY